MGTALRVYLRDHEAAAQAGRDLFRRAASSQRDRPYGAELERLATEVEEDLQALRRLMTSAGVQPDLLLGAAMRIAERAGRLKPNGHLLSRAPLSDLIEVEGLLDAVQAKAAGWRALAAAGGVSPADTEAIETLIERADDQQQRLRAIHEEVAARVLPGDG